MKALDRYVKKTGKAHPYGKSKSKGSWEGGKGIKKDDQYAKESGRKVVEDEKDYEETDPGSKIGRYGAYESVRGYKGKKKSQRSYLEG